MWVAEVYKMYEVQKYMTMTRHVYSGHIDVASLAWWNKLDPKTQKLIKDCMYQAAVYQRKFNRDNDAKRLALLKEKGMQIEMEPDVASFREKVAGLKDMDLFQEPKVQQMLVKFMDATK